MIVIRLTMRLYKRHDIDLLCIYMQPNHSLQHTIKRAVLAYINGENIKLTYPCSSSLIADLPSTAQFHLYLSSRSEDDLKIINFISNIPPGFKNSFLKNITRYYFSAPVNFSFTNGVVNLNPKTE